MTVRMKGAQALQILSTKRSQWGSTKIYQRQEALSEDLGSTLSFWPSKNFSFRV